DRLISHNLSRYSLYVFSHAGFHSCGSGSAARRIFLDQGQGEVQCLPAAFITQGAQANSVEHEITALGHGPESCADANVVQALAGYRSREICQSSSGTCRFRVWMVANHCRGKTTEALKRADR